MPSSVSQNSLPPSARTPLTPIDKNKLSIGKVTTEKHSSPADRTSKHLSATRPNTTTTSPSVTTLNPLSPSLASSFPPASSALSTIAADAVRINPEVHFQANRLSQCISAPKSSYEPYKRISCHYALPVMLSDNSVVDPTQHQILYPLLYHKNNCIVLSAYEATAEELSHDHISGSEARIASYVAQLAWDYEARQEQEIKGREKKEKHKLWICHISVVQQDVRLVNYYWTAENQRAMVVNHGPELRSLVSRWSIDKQELPIYWTLEDWVLARVEEEVVAAKEEMEEVELLEGEKREVDVINVPGDEIKSGQESK